MKHPLLALPLSALLVLTGCGGSGSGGDDAPPPPPPPPSATPPTVTVTAPATAVTTIAFDVAWSSTDATSCSSEFSDKTTPSGTETIIATEGGTATYSVTCTGAGGTATGSADVAVTELGSAQGLWQGSSTGNGGSRTVSGVVTDQNQYWLVYNGVNATAGDPAGFFVGTGVTTNDSTTAGTFNDNSLVEFSFEGSGSGVGSLLTDFTDKATLNGEATSALSHTQGAQEYTIDGFDDGTTILTSAPDPVTFTDGGTPWTITPNVFDPVAAPGISGTLHFTDYKIHLDVGGIGAIIVDISYGSRVLTIDQGPNYMVVFDDSSDPAHVAQPTLLITGINYQETGDSECTDGGGGYCDFIPTTVAHGDMLITFDDNTLTSYTGVAHAFQEVNAPGAIEPNPDAICVKDTYSTPIDPLADPNVCANAEFTFSGTIAASASSTITQTFTTTYNAAYDTSADLDTVAGSYVGNAGVGTVLEPSSALDIAGGAITGTTATSDCAIAGTIAEHGNKNVYDVTNLTFTDNGGSTCALVGETFKGVATYDADNDQVTITATNDAKSKGFLYVGTRAP